MKKSILALAAGLGLLMSNPSYAKDKDFNRVVESLKNCAYSSYKNQSNPSQENASVEQSNCSKFETLKREKGISSLEDYFEKNGWFYANSKEITDGKQVNSHYAAPIVSKTVKEGFPVYFTRLENGVDSFDGFVYNFKYMRTLNNGSDNTKKLVIDIEQIEKDAPKVEKSWKGYKLNHSSLARGDLENWNPAFESVYLSLKNSKHISRDYIKTKTNSHLSHELMHARQNHDYADVLGEKIAISAEVNNSPINLSRIQKNALKGYEADNTVIQCLMGKDNQAKFYSKGKKYIQQRADYCKKQFMKQR